MRNGKAVAERDGKNSTTGLEGEALALAAAAAALEKKAEDPVLLDLRGRSGFADYFLLVSGTSDRQVLAIADEVEGRLKQSGVRALGVEGRETGQWVLIDFSDVVVHVFHEDAREFYDLDGLWADAPRVEIPGAPPPSAQAW